MPVVSRKTLKNLAAAVWLFGAVMLLIKCGSLFYEAKLIQPDNQYIMLGVIAGLLFGGLKSRFFMVRFCRNNLLRISKLQTPKVHQFFSPGFFAALVLMILAGSFLSNFAVGNFTALLIVAILDLSIGTALLESSRVFLQKEIKI